MDLILNINRVGPQGEGEHSATTCVMVTHNPEIECYADRILYVQDGQFVKQALNEVQTAIKEEEYTHYLHADDDDWDTKFAAIIYIAIDKRPKITLLILSRQKI